MAAHLVASPMLRGEVQVLRDAGLVADSPQEVGRFEAVSRRNRLRNGSTWPETRAFEVGPGPAARQPLAGIGGGAAWRGRRRLRSSRGL